jgi:hypothetical protein
MVPSGVGGFSVRGRFLLTAPSFSGASWGTSWARATLPFFSARAAFAVSSREVVALEVAFLRAIAALLCQNANGGCQMLVPIDTWSNESKHLGKEGTQVLNKRHAWNCSVFLKRVPSMYSATVFIGNGVGGCALPSTIMPLLRATASEYSPYRIIIAMLSTT